MLKNPSLVANGNLGMYVSTSGASQTTSFRTDSSAHSGNSYARVTLTGSGAQTLNYQLSTDSIDATFLPNTPYTLTAKIRPSKNITFNAQFNWTTSGGATITGPQSVIVAPASTWTTLYLTGQSASHVTVRAVISTAAGSTWAPGDTLDIDSMMLTQGTTIYQYRDGSYPGWAWNTPGQPNNSSSTGQTLPE